MKNRNIQKNEKLLNTFLFMLKTIQCIQYLKTAKHSEFLCCSWGLLNAIAGGFQFLMQLLINTQKPK